RTLKREIQSCPILIIWTDCDREGENIGYEIIDICKAVRPQTKIYRAKFSEITTQSAVRALANLQQPNNDINMAVNVRQILDLRIGAAFTRFQTLRLQRLYSTELKEKVISYGSCQFPTLGFVVERYQQRENFIKELFWKIVVEHKTDSEKICDFVWERGRLFEHHACLMLYDMIMEEPLAKVIDVKGKNKSKWRPVALDTVVKELEKLASRKLRLSGKKTMEIAEKLYTKGMISYPRTETNKFPKEINLVPLVQNQTVDPNWGAFAQRVLNDGPNPRNGKQTDQAHPPIHPTRYPDQQLQGDEKRVYELIVRHFLACVSKDAQGDETIVQIMINNEKFSASGLIIRERNYLDVYPYDKWSDKEIPRYDVNQTFYPSKIEMVQGETTAPQLLTEADLISLMEKHGIGTDATHAEHIDKIQERTYVAMNDERRFSPEKLGLGLCEGYDAMGHALAKPHLRAELEQQLKMVCDGRANSEDVLREQIEKYRQVFVDTSMQIQKLDDSMSKYFGNPVQQPRQQTIFGDATNRQQQLANQPRLAGPNGFQPQTRNNRNGPQNGQDNDNNDNGPRCHCGERARLCTVKKEGANKGRKFYGCEKGMTDSCGFFSWAPDNVQQTQTRQPNNRRNGQNGQQPQSRKRRRSADDSTDGGQTTTRKCSYCKQSGHTRPKCPQLRDD
ncbi:unnamed protein product, partial [Didymodactylos carnosus]